MTAAAKLLLCHVAKEIDAGRSIEVTQTKIRHCIDIIGGIPELEAKEPQLWRDAHEHWVPNLPTNYNRPDVNVLGAPAKEYLARTFRTNCVNHVALNFENRLEQYVASVVGRDVDVDDKCDATTRRRVLRTVFCCAQASLADADVVRKLVVAKRAQFEACDRKQPTAKAGRKRKAAEVDPEEEDVEASRSIAWLAKNEDAIVVHALRIRNAFGVAKHHKITSANFEAYLPFMRTVQLRQEWEQTQVLPLKSFHPMTILPNKGLAASNITIDNAGLRVMHGKMRNLQSLGLGKKVPFEALWSHYFNLEAVRRKGWVMDAALVTDGVGCTIRLKRPLEPGQKQSAKADDERVFGWRPLDLKGKRVVGVDPGRRDLFACVEGELSSDGKTLMSKRKAHCSNKEYRHKCGFRAAERRHQRELDRRPDVRTFYEGMPSARTGGAAGPIAHLEAYARGHVEATSLMLMKKHRNEQFNRARAVQRTMAELCARITGGGDESEVVVAFGSAGFAHNSRGHGSSPTKGLKRALAKRACTVLDANEFRSSKQCSCCGGDLSDRHNGVELALGLRRCNNECASFWNRDVNAARNILNRFISEQRGLGVPKQFLPRGATERELVMGNSSAPKRCRGG